MTDLAPSPGRATFRFEADLSPQVLMRLLGVVAQQARTPARVDVQAIDDCLRGLIVVDDVDDQRADLLVGKMRQIISIRSVEVDMSSHFAGAPT